MDQRTKLRTKLKSLRQEHRHKCDFGLGNGFLAVIPKAQATKKVDNLDFIKIKTFFLLQRAPSKK